MCSQQNSYTLPVPRYNLQGLDLVFEHEVVLRNLENPLYKHDIDLGRCPGTKCEHSLGPRI